MVIFNKPRLFITVKAGASLMLTIDAKYQKQVQAAFKRVYSSAEAAGAARYLQWCV